MKGFSLSVIRGLDVIKVIFSYGESKDDKRFRIRGLVLVSWKDLKVS